MPQQLVECCQSRAVTHPAAVARMDIALCADISLHDRGYEGKADWLVRRAAVRPRNAGHSYARVDLQPPHQTGSHFIGSLGTHRAVRCNRLRPHAQ